MSLEMVRERAIGIVRVSQTSGRAGESFTSPKTQRERIEQECERHGLELIDVFDELDVSGGKPLPQRPGLLRAVEAVEAGEARVIVVAYFDRLVRSLHTQAEVLERIEAAGGRVRAVDAGNVGSATSGEWLNATMRGMLAEYQRRQGAERTRDAQADAIARGVALWPRITPGYRRRDDGRLEVDEQLAPAIREAFELRADGASIATVREHLKRHGIHSSFRSTQTLLSSRVLLGELHFGSYEPNLTAWPAIIERELFERVQAAVIPRGPQGKSDRLLSRLGVVVCAGCGGRMTVGRTTGNGRAITWSYRCPTPDCAARASIKAEDIEARVVTSARAAAIELEGRASIYEQARDAESAAERAQAALDAAFRTFEGFEDEPAARERLAELRHARDITRAEVVRLTASASAVSINALENWDSMPRDAQRALIRAVIDRAVVARGGRSADRVEIVLRRQSAASLSV